MSPEAGRLLGLDLGDVRIGLALSDPLGLTAQPLGHLERTGPRADTARIAELVGEHGVTTVVIGLPRLLSGEEGTRTADARAWAGRLEKRLGGVKIELWDERLTTVEAERTLIQGKVRRRKRKGVVDTVAAILILQGFLDARREEEGTIER